jgi:DNA-binding transcriptional MerR regulator
VKQNKPNRKAAIPRVLSSAECARRVGLTVRTLRVYERAGLVAPQRGANGWRVYGEHEMRRLNYVITLKTLGLTLRQILGVLSAAAPPSLAEILQLQLKLLLARQAAAERAIKVVRTALARLAASHSLSLDELCELARSTEMNHSLRLSTFRELVNEAITPEEEREYMTWWAKRPGEEAKSMQAFGEAQQVLFRGLEALRIRGADPASPKVQAVMDRHRELMTKHRVRERLVELMEWNPAVARKYIRVGERFRNRIMAEEKALSDPSGKSLFGFFVAALGASKAGQGFREILEEAKSLCKQKLPPSSEPALQLGRRLKSLCRRFKLGDPTAFALSTAFIAKTERNGAWHELDSGQQVPYRFLAKAVRAISKPGSG